MNGSGRVLVLTDNPANLERMRGLFAESAATEQVEYFAGRDEALKAASELEVKVVFAELDAGPQATLEFLNELWKVRPQTIRFLLARTLDPNLMVSCVLSTHHYLASPLEPAEFKAALDRAACIHKLVRNERILTLVSRMRTLPSRPSLYLEVLKELRSPSASAQAVGELVAKDLGISMKLIQVVNSAFYGLAQKVDDPSSAVLLMGLETTASLVLSIEAFSRFDQVKPLYFSTDRVWRHSQAVAHSARKIAELMSNDPEVARHAFTAGLVHDIGKLALALNFEEQYQGALKLAEKNKLPPCEVEADVFGATHAETGAYLLSLWGLPLPIVEAVAGHHLPASEVGSEFSALTALHLAERLHFELDQLKQGVTELRTDLAYPAALELEGRLDEIRNIIAGRETTDNDGTMILTRAQLKAVPVPVNIAATPAPLVEVKDGGFAARMGSKRAAIAASAAIAFGGLIIAAFTVFRSPAREKEQKLAAEVQEYRTERQERPQQLSTRLAESVRTIEKVAARAEEALPSFDDLKLQALIYNGTKSSIIINGRSFRVGDEISGAKIVAVQPREVILERAGAQHTLRLN